MQAGKLDRRITLQRNDGSPSSADREFVDDWTDVATVWANKRDVRGNEAYAGAERFAEVTTQFRIRYRSDIEPRWQIAYGGREYDIVAVLELPGGRREGLDILATARAEPDPDA